MLTLRVMHGDQEKLGGWDVKKGTVVQASLMCQRGGIVCMLQNQNFNFHKTLGLYEEWLLLLLIQTVKLHGRVIT